MLGKEDSNIIFEALTDDRIEQTTWFVAQVLVKDEPLIMTANIPIQQGLFISSIVAEQCRDDNYSVIAIDTTTNKVIGAALVSTSEETYRKYKQYCQHRESQLKYYFEALNILDQKAASGLQSDFGGISQASIYWLAVHGSYRGRGIGLRLFRQAEDLCRKKGILCLVTQAANTFTGKICQKLNWKLYSELDIQQVQIEGKYPFKEVPHQHRTTRFFAKKLSL